MNGVVISRSGNVVTACLDGGRANALSHERYRALREAADAITPEQVLVLRGAGENFCAGQDLAEHEQAVRSGTVAAELQHGAAAVLAVLRCRGQVVVAAQGAAIGAGALLVAAADVAVLTEDACLSLPELRLGLPLGASIMQRLLPAATVRRMMLTGASIEAGAVAATGAAYVVARQDLEHEVAGVVADITSIDPAVRRLGPALWIDDGRGRAAREYERELERCLRLLAGG